MSKHRPSKDSPQYWLGRLFKNSYTRGGRVFQLQNWSVKIQHAGERRAISLAGRTRLEAAQEAKAIYDAVQAEGWASVLQRRHKPAASVQATSGRREFWKDRLVRRRYQFPQAGAPDRALTARIDHAGRAFYFPTGHAELEPATERAQQIYDTVAAHGWEAACQRFARELTVGFEWSAQPVMWTYTTIHTAVGQAEPQASPPASGGGAARVLVIEGDPGIRQSLIWCLEEAGTVRAFACARAEEMAAALAHYKPRVVLVNRNFAGRVTAAPRHALVVSYSVARDGDELFASTPGGSEGYIFKRIAPTSLLEPIAGPDGDMTPTLDFFQARIRSYFKDLFLPAAASEAARLGKLTRREKDVLGLLSKGYMDKEIAESLGISAWTVHDHIKSIFERLRVRTRTEAVARYLEK